MNSEIRKKNVNGYYISCNELRKLALTIKKTIGKVEDIAVNASIVASQAGNQARVFFEIAGQMEKTSLKMRMSINTVIQTVSNLIAHALISNTTDRSIQYYQLANMDSMRPENKILITKIIKHLENEIQTNFYQLQYGIKELQNYIEIFEYLINRIFVSLTALRIEEELFRKQLGAITLESLIKSFEDLLSVLTDNFETIRDYFMKFDYFNN